ncbi:LysE family translocator [Jonesia quinghaiensis]|uniref:LysE family translocator n=1 Tax=Jonesia quinghaiensis TaxID=262806 RepID=UPI001FE08832|nr:LysE family translocator [Jonesia quinghaiensis]
MTYTHQMLQSAAAQSLVGMQVRASAVLGMALAALTMVLTPGPNMMYLVSRSISQGRAAGLVSLAGTGIGFLVYMTMANLGLAVVFVAVPALFVGVKVCGVLYLGYLAWQALRPQGRGVFETGATGVDSPAKLFGMGLATNLLNPKTAVMYLALIPQFIDPHTGNTVVQGFVLGGVQVTVSLLVNAAIVMCAGSIAGFLVARPLWVVWQRRATGTLLGCAAIALAWEVPAKA